MQQLLIISLVCLTIGWVALVATTGGEVERISQRLEMFAVDPERKSTGLTYEEYLSMFLESKSIPEEQLIEKRKTSPKFRLLQDFVLVPMDRWRPSWDEDDITQRAYVNRMEQTYKRFWPVYVHQRTTSSGRMYDAKKYQAFMNRVEGKVPGEPTLKLWNLAKEEYAALREKAEEIVTSEDVYDKLQAYELLMNYFNDSLRKFIMESYSDRLKDCKNDEELMLIMEEYKGSVFGKKRVIKVAVE